MAVDSYGGHQALTHVTNVSCSSKWRWNDWGNKRMCRNDII